MVRLLRWLLGYVVFTFSDGFCEGFINKCYEKGLNIYDIRRTKKGITACCRPKSYFFLHRIALAHGGIVSVSERHGPIFFLAKYKARTGLFLGLFCFVGIICFLNGFVWNVEVTGNEKISTSQVTAFLEENDFSVGTYWRSADIDRLESLMMASFDKCAWVHINRDGATAVVELNETVPIPDVRKQNKAVNLKAKKDGIIVSTKVYDGWQVAKVGDSVVAGDILVSGVRESEEQKKNLFAHARGDFMAQVKEKFTVTVSRSQAVKSYDKEKTYRTLCFFGIKLPLYIGSSYRMYSDDKIDSDYVRLNNKVLPIGVIKKTVRPYYLDTVDLTDKELSTLVKDEINRKLEKDYSDCEILSQEVNTEIKSDCAVATVELLCVENIGKEYVLKK